MFAFLCHVRKYRKWSTCAARCVLIISAHNYTLKSAGLKTTKLELFGNPALGKYWTEHMLGYFDPVGWVECFYPPCWVVLFKSTIV